jgi:caa(3)-type oxidase subunit IV
MTDTHSSEAPHGPSVTAYNAVFGALIVFTAVSFLVNFALGRGVVAGFIIILGVAVCKATLVAMYFMHLVVDWRKVCILIIPALVLGPLLIIVLWPDSVLVWQQLYAATGP